VQCAGGNARLQQKKEKGVRNAATQPPAERREKVAAAAARTFIEMSPAMKALPSRRQAQRVKASLGLRFRLARSAPTPSHASLAARKRCRACRCACLSPVPSSSRAASPYRATAGEATVPRK